MGSILAGITKSLIATFLTEKVIIKLMLELAIYLANKSSNTLDNKLVKILEDAYNRK
jgi:hypothetical protein